MNKSICLILTACFCGLGSLFAAPDFKIRYNQKFPCLEVMDSKAVKITDVTEGAKGETVTSGKASITISFLKNAEGLPEVTLREAKSPLSEMEIEAFGLAVGLKPEGTVLVRFGADNKPKFEMDRTGGSRFLMADLGNLDTAAGKEVAANTPPSKNLIRCRERLADWIAGKGGWSNKSGKILATEGGSTVVLAGLPDRAIEVSESFQKGGTLTVGAKDSLLFQSGAGVFHLALPGTVITLGKLESGSTDLKVELVKGTLQTFVAEPLKAPRSSLINLGNGVVARTSDGSYQISLGSGAEGGTTLTAVAGKVILAEEAGGKEVSSLTGEQTLSWPGGKPKALAQNSPEKSSLLALQGLCKETVLVDIARDGVKACPEAIEEIISGAVKANSASARKVAEQCLRAQPKFVQAIRDASGFSDLKLSAEEQAKCDALASLDNRLAQILKDGIDLEMKAGQVLAFEGEVKVNDRPEAIKDGHIFNLKDKITTGKSGRVLLGMAPGVLLAIEPNSIATLEKMTAEIEGGKLKSRSAIVNSEDGLVVLNIAPWNKEMTDVRVKTSSGESVARGTVFAVSLAGGVMTTSVSRGQVSSINASGQSVEIGAGQSAAPGAASATATPANAPAAAACSKASGEAVSAIVSNLSASLAAAMPTAAGEIAAIAAQAFPAAAAQIASAVAVNVPAAAAQIASAVATAVPAAAAQIASAVAVSVPAAAVQIAQSVAAAVPAAAASVATAVIAAVPGADASAISSATTAAGSGAAAAAAATDTAAGGESPAGTETAAGSNQGADTQAPQPPAPPVQSNNNNGNATPV